MKLLSQFTGKEGGGDFVEYAKELVVNEQFEEHRMLIDILSENIEYEVANDLFSKWY